MLTFNDSRFIFIDEVGFSISLRTRRGRALVENSAYIPVTAIRSRNMSVVAVMPKYEMVDFQIDERPVNGDYFKSFLALLSEKCLEKGISELIFIMDNARIHHYQSVSDLLQKWIKG